MLCRDGTKEKRAETAYDHAQPDLLSTVLLLDSLVQDDVQKDVISAEDANDLSTAVQLNEQSLVEILRRISARMKATRDKQQS